jgi:hypothetical protein
VTRSIGVASCLLVAACHSSSLPEASRASLDGVLFSDSFSTVVPIDSGLGPDWSIVSGLWFADGLAETDLDGGDQASENRVSCADCRVEAQVIAYGAPEAGVYLRAPAPTLAGDRYDFVLLGSGDVQLRRFRGGVATVLGEAQSGVIDPSEPTTLALEASGAGPVVLVASLAGIPVLQVSDADPAAIVGSGFAGMWSSSAGVGLGAFVLTGVSGPVDGGAADHGTPVDAGVADQGAPVDAAVAPDLAQPNGDNPIVRENARPGSGSWALNNPATNHEVEGYASLASVPRGGRIRFYVRSTEPSYTIQIVRLGWYGGRGSRALTDPLSRPSTPQPACPMDPATGMVECNWVDPYVLDVPNAPDSADWATGLYVAHITSDASGHDAMIRFVVRDDARSSPYLFQSSVTTAQAYSAWGGKSLYDFNSSGGRAHMVSFNRPNDSLSVDSYETSMVRFLEREGYDVSYTTDVETHEDGAHLRSHRAFLSVGHDEYWSSAMRDHVEAARDAGVNLAFFDANTSFWQVRFQPSPVDGTPDRTLVCYKDATLDPQGGTPLATVRFHDPPANRPEEQMIGVMYVYDPVDADLIVVNTSHWLFANTGLHDGDALHRLLGYEVDAIVNGGHPGLVQLGHSPFVDGTGATRYSDMTLYSAPSGAMVFAAGTIWWSWGLDDAFQPDRFSSAAQQITRNVLDRFGVR